MSLSRPPRAFPALFAGVLAVIAMAVPLPYGPRWEAGLPVGDGPPMCVRLTDGQSAHESLVPPSALLLRRPAPMSQNWNVAKFSGTHSVDDEGWWRKIDSDSIEIRWHHSPSIRFTVEGTRVTGTEQPAGAMPLPLIVFGRTRAVSGAVIPCPATWPPNERWSR